MKNEKTIYIIFIITVAFCIVFSADIYSSVKSYKYRRLCDEYREQLITATNANREFEDRIGKIAEVVGRITETAERNVTDAREIIETVEILRSQIKELEDCCNSFSQSDYYQHWDNEFHDEQLMD